MQFEVCVYCDIFKILNLNTSISLSIYIYVHVTTSPLYVNTQVQHMRIDPVVLYILHGELYCEIYKSGSECDVGTRWYL